MTLGTLEVVVPARNAGRFLGATLQSVALQHVLPQAVTVVDDGSTDDTAAVAVACTTDYAAFLPIRLLHNPGPRGPSAARNLAIRRSDAELIALLDAGDLLAPTHHQILLSAIRSAPDIDISYSFYLLHDDIGFVMMKWLLHWGVNAYVTLVLTFGVAVAISYAMNRLVERPGQRALRAFFARNRERVLAVRRPLAVEKPLAGD
jgi:glycosyltransferase involved in cell wall biosynthesis